MAFLARFQKAFAACQQQIVIGAFWLTIGVAALALAWFPLLQLQTTGYLFFDNAADEHIYLQYDYSKALFGPSRLAQIVVTLGHEVGLSGGWINLLFDAACLVILPLLFRAIFVALGGSRGSAGLLALGLCFIPALFITTINPLLMKVMTRVLGNDALLYWITGPIPGYWYLPISRTPEPQVSMILMSSVVLFSLRLRSFWPAYLAVPFLYSFVAVPYTFCLLATHGQHLLRKAGYAGWLAYPGAAALVGGLCGVFLAFFTPDFYLRILAQSHLPIVSLTGAMALVLAAALHRFTPERLRPLSWAVALAPTVAVNMQVLTGYFATPHSFEHNAGIVCCALVLLFPCITLLENRWAACVWVAGLALLIGFHARSSYRVQQDLTSRVPFSPELVEALTSKTELVAINDRYAASLVPMMFPRQPITVFGDQTVSGVLPDSTYDDYLHAKRTIEADPALAPAFQPVIRELDHFFRHMNADWKLSHLGRHTDFFNWRDPAKVIDAAAFPKVRAFTANVP